MCPQCRLAAGLCQLGACHLCQVGEGWPSRTWKKLSRSLCDLSARSVQRGRRHWTSAFPHLNTWLGQPASAASSEPGSEASSILDSASRRKLEEDDFSEVNFVISTTGVIGDPSGHSEPIGVTSVMAVSYGHAAHRCGNYGPIRHSTNRCASELCNNSGDTQYSWARRGCGI